MRETIVRFNRDIDFVDKFLIISVLLIPISLAISIFVADFLASLSGLILVSIILQTKNRNIFKLVKKEIIFFLILYFLILISLVLSDFKNQSFLSSFFYFRYFLMSLSIFYLLKKYDFFLSFFYYFFIISIIIVICDALLQYFLEPATNILVEWGFNENPCWGPVLIVKIGKEDSRLETCDEDDLAVIEPLVKYLD